MDPIWITRTPGLFYAYAPNPEACCLWSTAPLISAWTIRIQGAYDRYAYFYLQGNLAAAQAQALKLLAAQITNELYLVNNLRAGSQVKPCDRCLGVGSVRDLPPAISRRCPLCHGIGYVQLAYNLTGEPTSQTIEEVDYQNLPRGGFF